MGLFHWRDEGELIRPGFNIYPLASKFSAGGYLRIGNLRFYLRWSKPLRRFFSDVSWQDSADAASPRSQIRRA